MLLRYEEVIITSQLPLGAYVGNPTVRDPTSEAAFEQRFNEFTAAVGRAPTFLDTFTDFSNGWSGMVPSAEFDAESFAASPLAQNTTPVIGIPLATTADWGQQPALGTFADIAAGKYDDVYRGIVEAWRDNGYTAPYMRIGWEMDGNYMPWSMGDDANSVAAWKAAFRHVADVIHSVPGTDAKVVWNPAITNNNSVPVDQSYPGDDVVDVVGLDIYSPTYPYDSTVTEQQYWDHPSASQYHPDGQPGGPGWGMADTLAFATAHDKPVGIAETGAGGDGSHGPTDDPALPAYLDARLTAPGGPQVAFVNVWDTTQSDGDWHFSGGAKPLESAAWNQAFASTGTAASDTIVLHASADSWQGDPQFTVSIDGIAQGGTLTATASHSAGASTAFTFSGVPATSTPHDVAVTFLNDAYGGDSSTDRNLHVDGIDLNGTPEAPAATLYTNGTQNFQLVGDTVVLHASADSWQGDPQFTVSIDGVAQGGTMTATASHSAGASTAFTFSGLPSLTVHDIGVTFVNDAYGGTAQTDRNLYVDGIDLNGGSTGTSSTFYWSGTQHFQIHTSVS